MSRKKSRPLVPVEVSEKRATESVQPGPTRDSRKHAVRTVTRINRKLVLLTAGAFVLCGASVHGLHAFMVDRNADGILARADAAEERGEMQEAVKLLSQYLQFRPDNIDARERLALLLHRPENPPRAAQRVYAALEEVVRKDPSRADLRKPLSEAAIQVERFADAEFHLDELLKTRPDDPELVRLKAKARAGHAQQAARREAAELYIAAIGLDGSAVDAYAELAALLEQHDDALPFWSADQRRFLDTAIEPGSESAVPADGTPTSDSDRWAAANDESLLHAFPAERRATTAKAAASRILDLMVERAKPQWKAWEARARHRNATGDIAGAVADIRRACDVAEAMADSDFLLLAATVELTAATTPELAGNDSSPAAHREKAIELANRGLESAKPDAFFYAVLADAEIAGGVTPASLAAAEDHVRKGLEFVDARRGKAEAVETQRLNVAGIQLRLSLGNLLIIRGENDPNRSEATEQAVAEVMAEQLQRLREDGCRPQLISLLEARTIALQRQWDQAAAALEALRPQLIGTPELTRQIDLMLGSCYLQLRNPDRRVEVFNRAKSEDPEWTQGRLALAEALLAAGRLDEAINEYELLKNASADVHRTIAALALRKELRKPAGDRDFTAVEKSIEEYRRSSPEAADVESLELELLLARNDFEKADENASAARAAAPDSPAAWRKWFGVALVRQDRSIEERLETAGQRLAEGERQFPTAVEPRLARVELVRVSNSGSVVEAINTATEKVDGFTADQRRELYRGLIESAARAGEKEAALSLWNKIIADRPDDLEAWIAVTQISADLGRDADVERAMDAVRRIEGSAGPNGNFVAAVRIITALERAPDDLGIAERNRRTDEARELLTRAAQQRAYWAAVPRALGLLEARAGRDDAAFEQFRRARELGDSSPEVLRGLVSHYGRTDRWDLAATVLDDAERDVPGLFRNPEIARLRSTVAMQQGNVDEALAVMQQAGESDRIEDRITRAELLDARYRRLSEQERQSEAGRATLADATAEFRQLTDDFASDPRAWLACVGHLVKNGDVEQARAVIGEAEVTLPAEPAADRLRCLALCRRAIQETPQAVELMRQAVAAAPDNARLRLEAATFFAVSGELAETRQQLDWLLDPANTVPAETTARARRLRAVATAASGRYEDLVKAVHSLGTTAAGIEIPVDDLRAQVALLARRQSLTDRRELIRLLETIRSRTALAPATQFTLEEKFALAALYQQTNQWTKARPLIEELQKEQIANADYVTAWIVGSLRDPAPATDDATLEADIRKSLDRLAGLEPNTMRLALTAAEFENRFQRPARAAQILTEYVATLTQGNGRDGAAVGPTELAELRAIAGRAEEMRLLDVAESCFDMLAKQSKNPNDGLLPAMFLGRQGRYDEALSRVENRAPGTSMEAAALTAVSIVSAGVPAAGHYARAEAVVNEALQQVPTSMRAAGLLAGLRMAQGQYDESEAMYRRILASTPGDVSVLNNLAWLLVVTGKDPQAAESLINEALAIAGPIPDLVDTQGVILLSLRRADEAARVLRDEFENSPTPRPVMGFHLATACMTLGQQDEAREALAEAQKLGLGIEMLHATEHDAYRELVRRLGGEL